MHSVNLSSVVFGVVELPVYLRSVGHSVHDAAHTLFVCTTENYIFFIISHIFEGQSLLSGNIIGHISHEIVFPRLPGVLLKHFLGGYF